MDGGDDVAEVNGFDTDNRQIAENREEKTITINLIIFMSIFVEAAFPKFELFLDDKQKRIKRIPFLFLTGFLNILWINSC